MWWECSECGGHVQGERAPDVCDQCGTGGAIFVPADDPTTGDLNGDSFRGVWLRAGLEHSKASFIALRPTRP